MPSPQAAVRIVLEARCELWVLRNQPLLHFGSENRSCASHALDIVNGAMELQHTSGWGKGCVCVCKRALVKTIDILGDDVCIRVCGNSAVPCVGFGTGNLRIA